MEYVIGCDVGSQGTKAILLSTTGDYVGEAYEGYPIDYPHPLWAEQPVERWLNALYPCHSTVAFGKRSRRAKCSGPEPGDAGGWRHPDRLSRSGICIRPLSGWTAGPAPSVSVSARNSTMNRSFG